MKTGIFKAPLAATVLLLAISAGANAQDTFWVDCSTLEGLNTTMDYLTFTNDAKDRPSLQGKLDEAQAKIDEDKVCDAGLKVSDFNNKVFRLDNATKPKIGESADGAIQCALEGSQALAEAWRTGCEDAGVPPRGKGPKNK